jgi:hypothetical protein
MQEPNPSKTPQFETAEYPAKPGTDQCKLCGQSIAGKYYRINGGMSCPSCAEKVARERPTDSHAAFVRAVLFGVGGALAGLIVYAVFGIITGLMIGYIALAVGFLVGKAMMAGSKGLGGRRYQIVALVLTYAAVALGEMSIGVYQLLKQEKSTQAKVQQAAPDPQAAHQDPAQVQRDSPQQPEPAQKSQVRFAAAIGQLLLYGLASPFLELQDGVSGVIGLVILFVGLRIAWKLTAGGLKLEIEGPFNNPVPSVAGS